jgi:hypothetical protein
MRCSGVRRRASSVVSGITNGVQVGTERHYSDTLLIFAAKGAMPEKYCRDRVGTTHNISPTMAALMQQWQALREQPLTTRHAFPEPHYDADAEILLLPSTVDGTLQRRALPGQDTFSLLDRLNGTLGDSDERNS